MLDDIEISNNQIAFCGDFNLIFDCKLETNGRNPVLKKTSLAKLIEIIESLNLSENQVSGFIQRRQDYFFVSNTLQDFFASFSTDHSPIFSHLKKGMVLFVEEDYGSLVSL